MIRLKLSGDLSPSAGVSLFLLTLVMWLSQAAVIPQNTSLLHMEYVKRSMSFINSVRPCFVFFISSLL